VVAVGFKEEEGPWVREEEEAAVEAEGCWGCGAMFGEDYQRDMPGVRGVGWWEILLWSLGAWKRWGS
jgi:hypothetical protein